MKSSDKKIYFASDFHLGVPDTESSLEREKKVVRWLDETMPHAEAYYLLGDLFDFWFEYRKVVPKGFVRLLGKLAEISDKGIPVHIFVGNHDLWMNGYLDRQIQAKVYHEPVEFEIKGKRFLLGHGDGVGPGDKGFKALKKVFTNSLAQRMFRLLHPDWGIAMADYFSSTSRKAQENEPITIEPENERQILYAREVLNDRHIDYFIFGHRHQPYQYNLNDNSSVINLGDWMSHYTFAEWDGKKLELKTYHG